MWRHYVFLNIQRGAAPMNISSWEWRALLTGYLGIAPKCLLSVFTRQAWKAAFIASESSGICPSWRHSIGIGPPIPIGVDPPCRPVAAVVSTKSDALALLKDHASSVLLQDYHALLWSVLRVHGRVSENCDRE